MTNSKIHKQIAALFNKCGLEELIMEPIQVTGGLMHKMYAVTTKHNKYAVKGLNPSIMKRTGVLEHIVNSEKISNSLSGIIPAISAIQFEDTPLLFLDGQYYMIFNWVIGESIFPPNISSEHCLKIEDLLGKIHKTNIDLLDSHENIEQTELYDWDFYLEQGRQIDAIWVDELSQNIAALELWNKESNEACKALSEHLVCSHRDLDPKNVLWQEDNPYIIDWEAAGYVNPYQELLEVLNYWADDGNGGLDKDKFQALYNAYNAVMGNYSVNWNVVLASGFSGMLGWLNYSFKRSLGMDNSSPDEKSIGTEQVFGTLKALKQYSGKTTLLIDWLSS